MGYRIGGLSELDEAFCVVSLMKCWRGVAVRLFVTYCSREGVHILVQLVAPTIVRIGKVQTYSIWSGSMPCCQWFDQTRLSHQQSASSKQIVPTRSPSGHVNPEGVCRSTSTRESCVRIFPHPHCRRESRVYRVEMTSSVCVLLLASEHMVHAHSSLTPSEQNAEISCSRRFSKKGGSTTHTASTVAASTTISSSRIASSYPGVLGKKIGEPTWLTKLAGAAEREGRHIWGPLENNIVVVLNSTGNGYQYH